MILQTAFVSIDANQDTAAGLRALKFRRALHFRPRQEKGPRVKSVKQLFLLKQSKPRQ